MQTSIWDKFVTELKMCEFKSEYNCDEKLSIHNKYDKGYKSLLSIKKNFIDFVKTFVKVEIGEEIQEDNVTLLDKEFIMSNFDKRESDLIYEIKSEKQNIFFILIELQSKVDKTMSYRMLNYMIEIWRKWDKNRNPNEKFILPQIVPCVLYNGKTRWNAPLELKELYGNVTEDYLPNYRYILIDIYRYKSEELLNFGNIISSAFYLDTATKEDMEYRLSKLGESLKNSDRKLIKEFVNWAINVLVLDDNKKEIIKNNVIKEDYDMGNLARIGKEIFNDGLSQGRKEGREEGRKEGQMKGRNEGKMQGRLEGKISSLQKILSKKLNSFPPQEIMQKLNAATIDKVEKIEDAIFEINSWEEVKYILE